MGKALEKHSTKPVEKKITFARAAQAAEDSGYAVVSLKAAQAAALLGQYIEQDIIKTVAPTILISTMQELKATIQECGRLLGLPKEEIDTNERDRIMKRQIDLIEQQISLAKTIQEAAVLVGKTAPQSQVLNPSFAPREQVVPQSPVQVNIGIRSNGDVKVDGQAA